MYYSTVLWNAAALLSSTKQSKPSMWRRTPDADDRPPDATGGCRRDAAWMLKNAEAMTLQRGGGATCKLDASDPKQRTYFDGYAAMRRRGDGGAATAARQRQNRRKVVGDKPRYFELGCLDEAIGTI